MTSYKTDRLHEIKKAIQDLGAAIEKLHHVEQMTERAEDMGSIRAEDADEIYAALKDLRPTAIATFDTESLRPWWNVVRDAIKESEARDEEVSA